jgi:CheY-like chemotaxis protein
MAVTGHHDPALVVISVVIAIFAAYTALDLASRVRLGEGWPAHLWLLAAAVAMGGGIWSMHFVAMLAFSLAMPMIYDLGLTVLLLIVAIAVTGIAFLVVNRLRSRRSGIVAAGAFMGLGIVAMHYTGMEAMRMAAGIIYDPLLGARGAETVLVVEDDEGVLQATSDALAGYGYRVLSARNGIEAMRVLEAGNIDLLLSDVVMPQGLNGVELARRARGIAGDIKVLLTSGYAGDVLARLDAENEFAILGKPFRQAELVARIGAILRESA